MNQDMNSQVLNALDVYEDGLQKKESSYQTSNKPFEEQLRAWMMRDGPMRDLDEIVSFVVRQKVQSMMTKLDNLEKMIKLVRAAVQADGQRMVNDSTHFSNLVDNTEIFIMTTAESINDVNASLRAIGGENAKGSTG